MASDEFRQKRLKPDPGVAARVIDSQLFAVTPSDWQFHRFNEVATRIWQLVEQECTVGEVIEKLVDEYEADPALVEEDCLKFISLMQEKGLLKSSGP